MEHRNDEELRQTSVEEHHILSKRGRTRLANRSAAQTEQPWHGGGLGRVPRRLMAGGSECGHVCPSPGPASSPTPSCFPGHHNGQYCSQATNHGQYVFTAGFPRYFLAWIPLEVVADGPDASDLPFRTSNIQLKHRVLFQLSGSHRRARALNRQAILYLTAHTDSRALVMPSRRTIEIYTMKARQGPLISVVVSTCTGLFHFSLVHSSSILVLRYSAVRPAPVCMFLGTLPVHPREYARPETMLETQL